MADIQTHDLQGYGSLRKCFTCGRWFHNEADAGAENEECDGSFGPSPSDPEKRRSGLLPVDSGEGSDV